MDSIFEFNMQSPFVNIPSPKFPPHSIEIFTKEEIDKLLKACTCSRKASPGNRRPFVMRRPSAFSKSLISRAKLGGLPEI